MYFSLSFTERYTCISLRNIVLISFSVHILIDWFKWHKSLKETIYSISSQNESEKKLQTLHDTRMLPMELNQ